MPRNHDDYSDIIGQSRPIIKNHPPLSIQARAAQFSPYAALVGHKDIILNEEDQAKLKTDLDHEITIIPETPEFPDEF